jgi:MoxR-like ATPase
MEIEEEPGPVGEAEIASAQQLGRQVALAITDAVEVRRDLLDLVLVCVVAEGHILIEDLPGVGKTTLARSVARAFDLQFARVQCTADLLPADVVGTNVFNQREDRFEFRPGPIFANVVIVDEINRASPKTQSGLLECMQERRVTVDVHTHELARPFVVLATQNPIEFEGTYPLPEAQVDRFMARVSMGYPSSAGEVAMLRAHEVSDRVDVLEPVATAAELLAVQDAARRIHASDALRGYVVSLLHRTRDDPRAELGRVATTPCPTTCRRWPRSCWRTASCSRPRRSTPAASGSSPTPWRRRRRCRSTACARPPPPRSSGSC